MKWHSRVLLAAACATGHTALASENTEILSETTLTESQCTATVKKVQASGKFTEDAILPICSSEVKSSKCDFFAEALSLASTHSDFTSKVFCKDMAEAHACSQMMDALYQSTSTKDLLFGECMRAPETKSEAYCAKMKSLLARSVQESDLDTMRACYMMQAYDEKDGEMDDKKKTESKKEAPVKEATKKEAPVKEASKKEAPVKEASKKQAPVKEVSKKEAPTKEATKKETKEVKHVAAKANHHASKPAVQEAVAKPTSLNANKTVTAHQASNKTVSAHTATKHDVAKYKSLAPKNKPAHKVNASATTQPAARKAHAAKTNATKTAPKAVALAKVNATKKQDDDKKYGGFLSGFVF